jgi:hypothetical protein
VANSYVLKALRILGLEEILKLSKAAFVKPVPMKRAAGEDLIVWSDAPETLDSATDNDEHMATILPFKKQLSDFTTVNESDLEPAKLKDQTSEPSNSIQSSEYILWNREQSKDANSPVLKKEAAKEYARSTEMYVVKTSTVKGKEKIRFANTNGVLVDKKQA